MKRVAKYIVIPVALWENKDLTWVEKVLLVELDNFSSTDDGYDKTFGKLANTMGISRNEVKDLIKSLYRKGALDAVVSDGETSYIPLLNRKRYIGRDDDDTTLDESTADAKADNVDYDAILAYWKEANPELRQPRCITPKMRKQIKATLKNNKCTVEDFRKAFFIIATSRFCNGDNDRNWQASFDWIISDRNGCFQKTLTGAYSKSAIERQKFEEIINGAGADPLQQIKNYYK